MGDLNLFAQRTLVRMTDTQASYAARELARARWGNQVAVRSAWTLIERADELPPELAAQVHAATERKAGHDADQ